MKAWETLGQNDRAIIRDLSENGPDCAKFLSRRHSIPPRETMDILAVLDKDGWLERVKGTFLFKRGFRKPKHMNHTYYRLTRMAARRLREL